MAKGKSNSSKVNQIEQIDETKKRCSGECKKFKKLEDYFMSWSPLHADSRLPVCKQCIKNMIDKDYSIESVRNVLRMIDRPFLADKWETAKEESTRRNRELFGMYMKLIGMNECKTMTWADSDDENKTMETQDASKLIKNNNQRKQNDINYDLEELKEKYGYGYPDDEYYLFEKKYQQLRTSFQLLTTMHEEYFREYCINKVKETLAKAQGDFKQAKEWAAMVKDVAEAGKLKPSQMSKADLSAGLDGFGQLARMVEENYEIQPILPKFIEQPKDKADVVLWCFVNYVRDLKGLPECDYKEIYNFYERRKREYESQMLDNKFDTIEEVDEDV